MIHFLGSDVHRPETIYAKMTEIMQELEKILDRGQLNKLTRINAELVLQNQPIDIEIPQEIKKGFWKQIPKARKCQYSSVGRATDS